MISVAIVDDDKVFAEGVQLLLNDTGEFTWMAACKSAKEALAILPGLKPDVVLMDIEMPEMSGIECLQLLKDQLPETRIMMLTKFDDNESIFRALAAGASSYITKDSVATKLHTAIIELRNGGAPMSAAIARKVVDWVQTHGPTDTDELSQREHEVLGFLAQGQRYKEIADNLKIALSTVCSHIGKIYEKLHVHTRAEAVRKYRRIRP